MIVFQFHLLSLPFSLSVRPLSPPSYHVLLTMEEEEEEEATTTTDGAALVRSPPRSARALTRPPARSLARSNVCDSYFSGCVMPNWALV